MLNFQFLRIRSWNLLGTLLLLAGVTACSTTSRHPASRMLSDKTEALTTADRHVGKVMTALNVVVNTVNEDPTGPYERFRSEVLRLDRAFAAIESESAELQEEIDAYYRAWGEEIRSLGNPELRQQSRERRTEIIGQLTSIQSDMQSLSSLFQPFAGNLRDLAAYLDNDLTPAGIEGAAPTIQELKLEAVQVQDAIRKVNAEIALLRGELSNLRE